MVYFCESFMGFRILRISVDFCLVYLWVFISKEWNCVWVRGTQAAGAYVLKK